MGKYPIETGNIVLILLGIVLVASAPYITYRTLREIRLKQSLKEKIGLQQWGSHGLNFVIAGLFLFAGVLFVLNNLRGNPLH